MPGEKVRLCGGSPLNRSVAAPSSTWNSKDWGLALGKKLQITTVKKWRLSKSPFESRPFCCDILHRNARYRLGGFTSPDGVFPLAVNWRLSW